MFNWIVGCLFGLFVIYLNCWLFIWIGWLFIWLVGFLDWLVVYLDWWLFLWVVDCFFYVVSGFVLFVLWLFVSCGLFISLFCLIIGWLFS